MEPRLGVQHTIKCIDIVKELDECYKASVMARFTNACDDIRINLENCLRVEYKERRDENRRVADERMKRYNNSNIKDPSI
jgi:hypothetical protein